MQESKRVNNEPGGRRLLFSSSPPSSPPPSMQHVCLQTVIIMVCTAGALLFQRKGPNKYLFRSIETWLQGTCKSHVAERPWTHKVKKHAKSSIFADSDDEGKGADDDADEGADDDAE